MFLFNFLLQADQDDGEDHHFDDVVQRIDQQKKHVLVTEGIGDAKGGKYKENGEHEGGSDGLNHGGAGREKVLHGGGGHEIHHQREDEHPRRVTRLLTHVGVVSSLLPLIQEHHGRIPQSTQDEARERGHQNSGAVALDMQISKLIHHIITK
jgi:hypothetical protein